MIVKRAFLPRYMEVVVTLRDFENLRVPDNKYVNNNYYYRTVWNLLRKHYFDRR